MAHVKDGAVAEKVETDVVRLLKGTKKRVLRNKIVRILLGILAAANYSDTVARPVVQNPNFMRLRFEGERTASKKESRKRLIQLLIPAFDAIWMEACSDGFPMTLENFEPISDMISILHYFAVIDDIHGWIQNRIFENFPLEGKSHECLLKKVNIMCANLFFSSLKRKEGKTDKDMEIIGAIETYIIGIFQKVGAADRQVIKLATKCAINAERYTGTQIIGKVLEDYVDKKRMNTLRRTCFNRLVESQLRYQDCPLVVSNWLVNNLGERVTELCAGYSNMLTSEKFNEAEEIELLVRKCLLVSNRLIQVILPERPGEQVSFCIDMCETVGRNLTSFGLFGEDSLADFINCINSWPKKIKNEFIDRHMIEIQKLWELEVMSPSFLMKLIQVLPKGERLFDLVLRCLFRQLGEIDAEYDGNIQRLHSECFSVLYAGDTELVFSIFANMERIEADMSREESLSAWLTICSLFIQKQAVTCELLAVAAEIIIRETGVPVVDEFVKNSIIKGCLEHILDQFPVEENGRMIMLCNYLVIMAKANPDQIPMLQRVLNRREMFKTELYWAICMRELEVIALSAQ